MTEAEPAAGGDETEGTTRTPARPDGGETTGGQQVEPGKGTGGAERRFWSARRAPSGLVALLVLVGAGALLYDVVAVRAGGPAQQWRRSVAAELATRQLDSAWVVGAAVAAALAGLWLIWLALTPGLRSVLPMRPPAEGTEVRAGLDRAAAELVLRDGALQVAGVAAARVRVGRRKIRARVDVRFREVAEVREELDEALAEGVLRLGLACPPQLSLTTRQPAEGS